MIVISRTREGVAHHECCSTAGYGVTPFTSLPLLSDIGDMVEVGVTGSDVVEPEPVWLDPASCQAGIDGLLGSMGVDTPLGVPGPPLVRRRVFRDLIS